MMPGASGRPNNHYNVKKIGRTGQEEDIDLYDGSIQETHGRNVAHRHQLGQM